MYRKLISKPEVRQRILKKLDFIPDSVMIKIQYLLSHGRLPNLKSPVRFTEKLQAYKLHLHDDLMTICADKYLVRKFVADQGLDHILIPLIGVYDDANEINFEEFPTQFVLKTNNGSHTNIICQNKELLDTRKATTDLNNWINNWQGKMGREWAYYNIVPKIIAEEYLTPDMSGELIDYKFFCFNGEPSHLYVISKRQSPAGPSLGIFDCNFNQIPFFRYDLNPLVEPLEKPNNFNEMLEIARKLSKPFPHARIDLYNVDGKIFFGEITFYDGSGYRQFYPDSFDYILGEKFDLSSLAHIDSK